jgi:hypothetical protein
MKLNYKIKMNPTKHQSFKTSVIKRDSSNNKPPRKKTTSNLIQSIKTPTKKISSNLISRNLPSTPVKQQSTQENVKVDITLRQETPIDKSASKTDLAFKRSQTLNIREPENLKLIAHYDHLETDNNNEDKLIQFKVAARFRPLNVLEDVIHY